MPQNPDYSQHVECEGCGRYFHPARFDAKYCNECRDNTLHPLGDEDRNDSESLNDALDEQGAIPLPRPRGGLGARVHRVPARVLALHRLPQDRQQDRNHPRTGSDVRQGGRPPSCSPTASSGCAPSSTRNRSTPPPSKGLKNFKRIFKDNQVATSVRITTDVHPFIGEHRTRARVPARGPVQPASRGARRHEGGHDPADLRDPARGRLPLLHHPLRGGRSARVSRIPRSCRTRIGPSSA